MEKTLILIKPDGVQRGLVGQIITRLETTGLKLVAMKMVHPSHEDVDRHYQMTEEWMQTVYTKAKAKYDANGEVFPFADHKAYGGEIKRGLVDFLKSSPVVALVLEGEMAVSLVRKLVGATEPASSAPGTIRGDFSHDTYALANSQGRPLRNLIHASGTIEEADNEIKIWFTDTELYAYEHVNDRVQYDPKWFLPTA
ncbi:MAG: nucleoside-diphosphate kinase [Candidatus Magasanikbacteria bacterium]|nr:nucleoside-diphosphate kinase [Candidatus Magasanikbacteria bacterium]MCA9389587.1 nucleoside-diphosphate kinase [Candidatus Magasanikbacteria bacterium]MCA9390740.1 nucleoside-diphosphate kinase [Candidatus Magasanikbacteria bacterium]USN52273.1 MAG: nucleoside-diphosphate kinase [Candidatus Nomurabacteria bacterium]HPF95103.1 nucleoside-diphosphate kinase [bacterium]